jgi:hypothetical protein
MRRSIVALAAFVALAALAGCSSKQTIDCATNADCIQGGVMGTCLASPASSEHWCAFSDPMCDGSRLRWGLASGDGLAAECVAGVGGEPARVTVTVQGEGHGTVLSSPTGIDCGTVCEHEFPTGADLELTATANLGSFFDGWAGACDGAVAQCTLQPTSPTDVTARFALTGSSRWLSQLHATQATLEAGAFASNSLVLAGNGFIGGTGGVIVTALDASTGVARWTKLFPTALGLMRVTSVAIDASGNAIVAGVMERPITFGSTTVALPPGGDSSHAAAIFLAKLSVADGAVVWAQSLGHLNQYGYLAPKVVVGADGSVYLGSSYEAPFSLANTAMYVTSGSQMMLAKFSAAGAPAWAAPVPGDGSATLRDVALDKQLNLVVGGDFNGELDIDGVHTAPLGKDDAFVAKFSTQDGTPLLVDYIRGDGKALAVDLAETRSGNTVLMGTYEGVVEVGASPLPGSQGLFVLEVSPGGSHVGSFGVATDSVTPQALTLGPDDQSLWITGSFSGVTSLGGAPLQPAGGADGFVACYTRSGSHIFSSRFGGTQVETGTAAIATENAIVVAGRFGMFADFGGETLTAAESTDGFMWSLVP